MSVIRYRISAVPKAVVEIAVLLMIASLIYGNFK